MTYETTIQLILEDTEDVKRFNLYKIRTRKVGRRNDLNPRDVNDYLDSLESMFDADVYNEMNEEEIMQDISAYFNRISIKKQKDYKIR